MSYRLAWFVRIAAAACGLLVSASNAAAAEPLAACPVRLSGATLAVKWPQYVGQSVRMNARISRATDFTTALIVSGKSRFIVTLAPDAAWDGEQEKWFTVMGRADVRDSGRTTLAALFLTDAVPCVE